MTLSDKAKENLLQQSKEDKDQTDKLVEELKDFTISKVIIHGEVHIIPKEDLERGFR